MSAPAGREVSTKRLTEAIEGSASPRKPRVRMSLRSSSGSLEVQCRSTASAISWRVMPTPSSTTERKLRPPSFRIDGDAMGAGIDRVLDQLLDRTRRTLDHLARGDAVDQGRGQAA